jgi:predicted Ser/Thr protein kinase
MHDIKDTARATVRIGYDGRVHKTFRGHFARERFDHEVRVLRYLETRSCDFVPRILEAEPETLKMVTTNCGTRVDQLNPERQREIFAELENFGVRHEDRELRNITYRISDGRFCIIDFEFATILDDGTGHAITLKPIVQL